MWQLIAAGVGGFLEYSEAYSSAQAAKLQAEGARLKGKRERANLDFNASMSEMAAKEEIEQGEREVSQVYQKGKQVRGSQRVRAAAQGIEIGAGSAGQLEADTVFLSEIDMIQARSNAWRKSWGHALTASEQRYQAKVAQSMAEIEAMGYDQKANFTLLTGGLALLKGGMKGMSGTGASMGGGGTPATAGGGTYGVSSGRVFPQMER